MKSHTAFAIVFFIPMIIIGISFLIEAIENEFTPGYILYPPLILFCIWKVIDSFKPLKKI